MNEMRPIMFRAWIEAEKRMIDWKDLLIEKDDEDGFFLWVKDDPNNVHSGATSERDFVLMQYAGLKDKYGTEIYEGDILVVGETENVTKVIFNKGCFCIPMDTGNYRLGDWQQNAIVIVGNIYENPELLEENQ